MIISDVKIKETHIKPGEIKDKMFLSGPIPMGKITIVIEKKAKERM